MYANYIDLFITVASVISGSAVTATIIPSKWLGPLNSIVQVLGMNFGHAQNQSKAGQ